LRFVETEEEIEGKESRSEESLDSREALKAPVHNLNDDEKTTFPGGWGAGPNREIQVAQARDCCFTKSGPIVFPKSLLLCSIAILR